MAIENIIFKLDKVFSKDDVYFDLGIWNRPDGVLFYKVWVSDYDTYTSKKFKKITELLRKKYPKVRWYSYYCSKNKSDEVD